jgi:DNA primase
MTAETIAKALGSRKAGSGWTAKCPAHDDRTPSLSISNAADGKLLVPCHAGCNQKQGVV